MMSRGRMVSKSLLSGVVVYQDCMLHIFTYDRVLRKISLNW